MSITFEKIQEVNKHLTTSNIKGKPYIEVNQRIKAFRMLYPNGCILTSIESLENGVVVMKAVVKDEEEHILGTGYAYEKESSSFINKTSYIENCETSAVGRALGMLGIGIDTSVASYEEVSNAIAQQEAQKAEAENKKIENSVINEVKVKALIARCEKEKVDAGKILELYKVSSLADLKEKQYANINLHWEKIKEA